MGTSGLLGEAVEKREINERNVLGRSDDLVI